MRYTAVRLPPLLRSPARALFARVAPQSDATGRPLQTGALPWRRNGTGGIEVLLVTGRNSKRWTIPKGWPMVRRSLAEAAAQEAFEEAGVRGAVDEAPLGRFDKSKNHRVLGRLEVSILVHSLAVETELEDWPERSQRARRWFAVGEAAGAVLPAGLGAIIARFHAQVSR